MPENSVNSRLGARLADHDRCSFRVWAPKAQTVELCIVSPSKRTIALEPDKRGYYSAWIEGVPAGTRYAYRLDGAKERPDPASRFQPLGVHGPSEVIDDRNFPWTDAAWVAPDLKRYIFYELHVGTFTPEGTFDSAIRQLDRLRTLGVTAIEVMPVAQFPGDRNWGYDGVYPFAVQNSYGGPDGFKRLVNACHEKGLAVVLDVVYNHLGPEGNYLGEFGNYFTDRYKTPWGAAMNFDGPQSDEVVRYFTENALTWMDDFHVDALRLDAIHGIVDVNAHPFLALLADSIHEFAQRRGRRIYLIAESDLNDVRVLRASQLGGLGMDAQWSDDFHHSLHALLTGERNGYYRDFGRVDHLAKALSEGFVYSGQYSAYRARRHGNSSDSVPPGRFVVCAQNHDQVGNRMLGDRLSTLVGFEKLKLAAGLLILSPFLPLLFMGEEYGETAPFQYFTSHSDPALIEAVRRGRRDEFAGFDWQAETPDPQAETTFLRSKLQPDLLQQSQHQILCQFYQMVIGLRKQMAALASAHKRRMEVTAAEDHNTLLIRRWAGRSDVLLAFNFQDQPASLSVRLTDGRWRKLLDSGEKRWLGPSEPAQQTIISEGPVGAQSVGAQKEREGVHEAIKVGGDAFVVLAREQ